MNRHDEDLRTTFLALVAVAFALLIVGAIGGCATTMTEASNGTHTLKQKQRVTIFAKQDEGAQDFMADVLSLDGVKWEIRSGNAARGQQGGDPFASMGSMLQAIGFPQLMQSVINQGNGGARGPKALGEPLPPLERAIRQPTQLDTLDVILTALERRLEAQGKGESLAGVRALEPEEVRKILDMLGLFMSSQN